MAYSTIALQEINIAYKYPTIYWNAACLSVNANAVNNEDYENLVDEGIVEIGEDDDKKKGGTSYDKIAIAIGKFKDFITIETPDINKAKMGFAPDVERNSIMFGLKGLTLVGDDVVLDIIANRPYNSLEDFVNKMVDITEDGKVKKLISRNKVVSLIKAGCFDNLEHKTREEIMNKFLNMIEPKKTNLTLSNFLGLIRDGLVPEELNGQVLLYLLTKEFRKHKDGNGFYNIPNAEIEERYLELGGTTPLEIDGCKKIRMTQWDAIYDKHMNKVRDWIKLNKSDLIDKMYEAAIGDLKKKYCSGNQLQWELDSMNFYHSGHPLVDTGTPMQFASIKDLVENESDGEWVIDGQIIPKMKLNTIFGTVLAKDKTKRTIVLSTPDGVIKCKIYKAQFSKYDKVIEDANGNKIQNSFFEKGTHLIITGILRDEVFIPKVYKNTKVQPLVKVYLTEDDKYIGMENKR